CPENKLEKTTDAWMQTPFALNAFPVPGKDCAKPFAFRLESETVTLVAFKKGEMEDGYVLRLQNNSENASSAVLNVNGQKIVLSFGHYEVKTVLYDGTLREVPDLLI
ncbi:MAG: hypothetical protein MJ078_09010, partial [Clostridia bacterium]|nr:hypothetical protein [Clostridia bacterium]